MLTTTKRTRRANKFIISGYGHQRKGERRNNETAFGDSVLNHTINKTLYIGSFGETDGKTNNEPEHQVDI